MLCRPRPFLAGLVTLLLALGAKAETAPVKDSTLTRARGALVHYDLGPDGTLSLLPALAKYAQEHKGSTQGDEAAFLRAAAASDLWFISNFTDDVALRTRLAEALGVETAALTEAIADALRASAHGVYRAQAEAALGGLEPGALHGRGPTDSRHDALALRRALQPEIPGALGAHFAVLGRDPCEGAKTCPEPLSQLDGQGRRSFGYMLELGATLQRLDKAAKLGDPLAAALDEPLAALRQQLLAARVRLSPRLGDEVTAVAAPDALGSPVPELFLVVSEAEVRFSRVPLARVTETGSAELIAQPDPVAPKTLPLVALRDLSSFTRPIDELIAALRKLQAAGEPIGSAGVTTAGSVPAHVLGRVLISLDKAGVHQLALLGRAPDGSLLDAPLHVTFAGISPIPATELKLRIRLGGYSLSLGGATLDIPRVKGEAGWHFDVERLRAAAEKRIVKSAAVSFMADVAAEQVLVALFQVRPGKNPVELVVQ